MGALELYILYLSLHYHCTDIACIYYRLASKEGDRSEYGAVTFVTDILKIVVNYLRRAVKKRKHSTIPRILISECTVTLPKM